MVRFASWSDLIKAGVASEDTWLHVLSSKPENVFAATSRLDNDAFKTQVSVFGRGDAIVACPFGNEGKVRIYHHCFVAPLHTDDPVSSPTVVLGLSGFDPGTTHFVELTEEARSKPTTAVPRGSKTLSKGTPSLEDLVDGVSTPDDVKKLKGKAEGGIMTEEEVRAAHNSVWLNPRHVSWFANRPTADAADIICTMVTLSNRRADKEIREADRKTPRARRRRRVR